MNWPSHFEVERKKKKKLLLMKEVFECLNGSCLSKDLICALQSKLKRQSSVNLVEPLTKTSILRLDRPVVLNQEMFCVAQLSLEALMNAGAVCNVWERSERLGVLERVAVKLSPDMRPSNGISRVFMDIQGLSKTVSASGEALLNGFDIFDEGEVLSFGSTFTPHHVEDYCLQNIATLQRVHDCPTDSFKVWFVTSTANATNGQKLRRSHDQRIGTDLVESADYVLVQLEGQTVYLPPLTYHAVLTGYSVTCKERFALLSGTCFADTRNGSLWRDCLPVWVRNHQTGYRHGSKKSVLKNYVKFLDKEENGRRRPTKKRKTKTLSIRAKRAAQKRWEKVK